jgi:hypothetical protein
VFLGAFTGVFDFGDCTLTLTARRYLSSSGLLSILQNTFSISILSGRGMSVRSSSLAEPNFGSGSQIPFQPAQAPVRTSAYRLSSPRPHTSKRIASLRK